LAVAAVVLKALPPVVRAVLAAAAVMGVVAEPGQQAKGTPVVRGLLLVLDTTQTVVVAVQGRPVAQDMAHTLMIQAEMAAPELHPQ
jgi:hypothetical protein